MTQRVKSGTVAQLLKDLAYEAPGYDDGWTTRADWDPMHGMAEIQQAAKLGYIELRKQKYPEVWRFRITGEGRIRQADYASEEFVAT